MDAELSFEELLMRKQEELLAKRSEERAKSRADIPERALIWLALPPLWTLELAEKCSFPTISGKGVHETLQRIYKERLCDCIPAGGELVIDESTGNTIVESERYYMSSSTSTEILQRVVRDTARGLRWLQHE